MQRGFVSWMWSWKRCVQLDTPCTNAVKFYKREQENPLSSPRCVTGSLSCFCFLGEGSLWRAHSYLWHLTCFHCSAGCAACLLWSRCSSGVWGSSAIGGILILHLRKIWVYFLVAVLLSRKKRCAKRNLCQPLLTNSDRRITTVLVCCSLNLLCCKILMLHTRWEQLGRPTLL